MKRYFLTVSLAALLSSPAFSSNPLEQARNLADAESKREVLITRVSNAYYTFDMDVDQRADAIKNAVVALNRRNGDQGELSINASDVKFEAKRRIANNLDTAKNSNAVFNGKRLTKNLKQGVLSVSDPDFPLVFPVFKKDREEPNAFLPVTYQSSYSGAYDINRALWQEIKTYANGRGLSSSEGARLYRYLEPLFYVAQEEVGKLMTGLHNRWCWTQGGREDMTTLLKNKTGRYTTIISNAGLSGFNPDQVKNWLMPRLLDQIFALLPDPFREIYRTGGGSVYKLGVNVHNKLSMIHPVTELPYPIFTEDRGQPDWNLPQNYQRSSALDKQWNRVHDFVRLDDRIRNQEESKMINLLEPVGYFFHKQLENFHVQGGDLPDQETGADQIIQMALMYANRHTIPQPYLEMFYQGDQDVHSALRNVQNKDDCHVILTANLWPQRLFDHKKQLADDLLNYLMFKDIVDRFKIFYPLKAQELERYSLVLDRFSSALN